MNWLRHAINQTKKILKKLQNEENVLQFQEYYYIYVYLIKEYITLIKKIKKNKLNNFIPQF